MPNLPLGSRVAVVGGGVSGLTFTYFLARLRPDIKITLYEAQQRCGGWINSSYIKDSNGNDVLVEKGPRTLRGVSDGSVVIIDLLKELGKQDVINYIDSKSEANRKFLLGQSNNLIQVPNSLVSTLNFLGSSLGKGLIPGLLGEAFRAPSASRKSDETAHDFIKRRFGTDKLSLNIFSAIFHGIYAGDIKELSAQRTIGKMVEMEKKAGSLIRNMINEAIASYRNKESTKSKVPMASPLLRQYADAMHKDIGELSHLATKLKAYPMLGFKGGLEMLPKSLFEQITRLPNVSIINSPITSILPCENPTTNRQIVRLVSDSRTDEYDHVRVTVNPQSLSKIVSSSGLKAKLDEVHSNTVIVVNFYSAKKDLIPSYHGFGYLVPQSNVNHEKLLGVIFDSVIEHNFKPVFGIKNENTPELGYTKLTAMLGGHFLNNEGSRNIPSKSIIINSTKYAFSNHLNISESDLQDGTWEVTIAENCLPQYHVGYNNWVAESKSQFNQVYGDSVSLGGMSFSSGPGVPNVVENSFQGAYNFRNKQN